MKKNNDYNYNTRIIIASIISTILMFLWVKYYGSKTLPQETLEATTKAEAEYIAENKQIEEVEKQLESQEKEILNENNELLNLDTNSQKIVKIDTEKLEGSINLQGLLFDNLTLKDYNKTIDSDEKVKLLNSQDNEIPYFVQFSWGNSDEKIKLPTKNTLWQADKEVLSLNNPVILTYNNNEGIIFQLMISIDENYMFTIKQSVINNTEEQFFVNIDNKISKKISNKEKIILNTYEGFIGSFNNNIEELKYKKLTKNNYNFNKNFSWAGFTDKYWLVSLATKITEGNLFSVNTNFKNDEYTASFNSENIIVSPNSKESITNYLFTGPKILNLLDDYSFQYDLVLFDRALDFGWFYFLTKPIYITLKGFYGLLGNFGLAILLLTFIIKIAMYPFTKKSFSSMAKMKALQPKMTELRSRYSEDKMKLNMEIMSLYKKEKVSPLSGCLPMLVQIPVFFSLYKVLSISIDMRQAPFYGYIKNLSAADPTTIWNLFGLLPYQVNFLPLGFLPCLMGLTMYIQQKMSGNASASPEAQSATKFMPLIFLVMFANMPTGLLIYWTFSNIISIAQQYWVEKNLSKNKEKEKNKGKIKNIKFKLK